MPAESKKQGVNRRRFLSGATAGGIATGVFGRTAQFGTAAAKDKEKTKTPPPNEQGLTMDEGGIEDYTPEERRTYFVEKPGSDYMVDVLKSLDIEYFAVNPGSSFRGLHESIVNYGANRRPEMLTCLHEEQAVAMAQGYSKIANKVMAVACHGTVGFQHAAMGVYNAWADRTPAIIIGGNHMASDDRRHRVDWLHSAQDPAGILRDYTKWDAHPASLQHFGEALVRAYKIATTPPFGPVVLIADAALQEEAVGNSPKIPKLTAVKPPQGETNAVEEAARMLVRAENPVLVADRMAHTQTGVDQLVELAEILQAPVIDRGGRMNFPNDHYLNQSRRGRAVLRDADLILSLEVNDVWGLLHRVRFSADAPTIRTGRDDVKVISIGANELFFKANYQSFQRYYGAELTIAGDGQATLPFLIESVRREMPRDRRGENDDRERKWRAAFDDISARILKEARLGWDSQPISLARLSAEIWDLIKDKDWGLCSRTAFQSWWPEKLWRITKSYQFAGSSGAAGVGYTGPGSVGAALAHRDAGRVALTIQGDGDLMYGPGAYWTAAHHNIPLLAILHNNGAYHQEVMHLQRMASRRRRGMDGSAKVGNVFEEPGIDHAQMIKGLGVWTAGAIENPADLRPALIKALDVIEQGDPAFLDVKCQPR